VTVRRSVTARIFARTLSHRIGTCFPPPRLSEDTPHVAKLHVDKGYTVRSRFVSANDVSLDVYADKRTFTIDRRAIRKICSVIQRSRSNRALVGAGIGLGTGVGLGFVQAATAREGADVSLAPVGLGFVGVFAGAAVGALTGGRHRGPLLYERK
jgi:hypothetical protein